jgi:acetyl esterase/lipase
VRSVGLFLLAGGLLCGGCPSPNQPTSDGSVPQPRVPDYINLLEVLGIQDDINRIATSLPAYTADIPGVDGEAVHAVEVIRDIPYRTTPQRVLTLDVHRPADAAPAPAAADPPRRAVMLFHGGGFVADGDFETTDVWAGFLASRGCVAFNVRYRLLTEPGANLPDIVTDAVAAARFVAAEGRTYGADPDRIATLGRSSGGQLALLVGLLPDPDQFGPAGDPSVPVRAKAVVAISTPTDDAALYTGRDFSLVQRTTIAAAYGGTPDQVPDLYAAMSPLTYVRSGLPAVLLVHGQLDTTVPIAQAIRLADALEAAGDTVWRDFQPDTGHVLGWGLFSNDGLGQALEVIVPFLEQNL